LYNINKESSRKVFVVLAKQLFKGKERFAGRREQNEETLAVIN